MPEGKKLSLDSPNIRHLTTGLNVLFDQMHRQENDGMCGVGDALWVVYNEIGEEEFEYWLEEQDGNIRDDWDYCMVLAEFAREHPGKYRKFKRLDREKMEVILMLPDLYLEQLAARPRFKMPDTGEMRSLPNMRMLRFLKLIHSLPASKKDRDDMICRVFTVRKDRLAMDVRWLPLYEARKDKEVLKDELKRIKEELRWHGELLKNL